MGSFLLTTKLQVPPQAHFEMRRPRLIDAIERNILNYKLLLLSAPAGYGKTTLLSQWARSSHLPIVWLSISNEDNNLDQFLRYLLTGWEEIQPALRESTLGMLLGDISPDIEEVLSAFINTANDNVDPLIFVLDDYHHINDPDIHTALTFLLDHLPSKLHFVLAGRDQPPLPLARYRVHQQLMELHTKDLAFLPDETTRFFNETMQLNLTQDELSKLHTQLEGWIASFQLVALTLQQPDHKANKLNVSGRHHFITDYLSENVLALLPDQLRNFLLQTSLLETLCGSLCDAVTGQENGQALLETLERKNLFLVPLDDNRDWFRYHRLFADFLYERLKRQHPAEVANLHRRAGYWYLENDLPEPAFQHAVDGQDSTLVLKIFEQYTQTKLIGGEFRALQSWLDSLPERWQFDYPLIGIIRTALLLFTGQLEAGIRSIDDVEQTIIQTGEDDTHQQLARVSAVRCSVACFQNDLVQAETFANQAFKDLPNEDYLFRVIIQGSLGDTYRRNGYWQKAKECYLSLLDFIQAPAFQLQSAHVYGALADLNLRQGHLKNAADYWRKALAVIEKRENWGRLPLPLTGWVNIRMAELLYEWNALAEAWEHLSRGLKHAELGGDVRALIAGYLIAGRIKLTQGETGMAAEYLEQARPLVEQSQFSHWISRFERFQLELWIAQDQLRAAVNWADKLLQTDALEDRAASEVAQLAIVRVLILKGDRPSLKQAQGLTEGLLLAAKEESRIGIEIEALILQAQIYWQYGQNTDTLTLLARALQLAAPEGYIRCFVDYGLPLARLLQEAQSRKVRPDYVETLLTAYGNEISLPASEKLMLPEPLTERELEILKLMAAGLTNHEIADTLVIAAGTVKKHASSIYGKLGVHNRTEASAKARELAILN